MWYALNLVLKKKKYIYRNDRIKTKTDVISEDFKLLWSYMCSLVEIYIFYRNDRIKIKIAPRSLMIHSDSHLAEVI